MKMSEKRSIAECYRRLIAAIVKQAIEDRAAWFLERPEVKRYCAAVGIAKQVEDTTRPVGVR
jgi:hypothetical protein